MTPALKTLEKWRTFIDIFLNPPRYRLRSHEKCLLHCIPFGTQISLTPHQRDIFERLDIYLKDFEIEGIMEALKAESRCYLSTQTPWQSGPASSAGHSPQPSPTRQKRALSEEGSPSKRVNGCAGGAAPNTPGRQLAAELENMSLGASAASAASDATQGQIVGKLVFFAERPSLAPFFLHLITIQNDPLFCIYKMFKEFEEFYEKEMSKKDAFFQDKECKPNIPQVEFDMPRSGWIKIISQIHHTETPYEPGSLNRTTFLNELKSAGADFLLANTLVQHFHQAALTGLYNDMILWLFQHQITPQPKEPGESSFTITVQTPYMIKVELNKKVSQFSLGIMSPTVVDLTDLPTDIDRSWTIKAELQLSYEPGSHNSLTQNPVIKVTRFFVNISGLDKIPAPILAPFSLTPDSLQKASRFYLNDLP